MTKAPNIYQRINAIMKDVSYVQKEQKKVNNQYRFVSHDAVTAAIQPHLVKHGVVVVPSVISHSQEWTQYETSFNNNKQTKFRGCTEVDVNVSFVNIDDPEDKFDVQFFGMGIDEQDKGPGKAFSYAKKYAFLQVFCLETGDDPERDNIDHKPAPASGKRGGAKNKDWVGPMDKAQLFNTYKSFADDFEQSTNIDDLKEMKDGPDFVAFRTQAEQDFPGLLTGWKNGDQTNEGLTGIYKTRMRELMQLAGVQ